MRIPLLALAERRLAWVAQRQAVLAQNIANSATPGYRPRDLRPFAQLLSAASSIAPARTQAGHLPGPAGDLLTEVSDARPAPHGPDGNSVTLEEQLTKVADTDTAQSLVTSIYKKYLGWFGLALGRSP